MLDMQYNGVRPKEGEYPFVVSNANLTGGKDPYPFEPKLILCVYKINWTVISVQVGEGQMLELKAPP
jgi:hypothetical protein